MKKTFVVLMAAVLCFSAISLFPASVSAATESLPNAPNINSAYYKIKSQGGLNRSAIAMPNCTTFAYARLYELTGKDPMLSTASAGAWWQANLDGRDSFGYITKYPSGQTPKLGAIACWQDGNSQNGHVAVVEKIVKSSDGKVTGVTVSESGYYSKTTTLAKTSYFGGDSTGRLVNISSGTFKGYIYAYNSTSTPTPPPTPNKPSVIANGTYYITNVSSSRRLNAFANSGKGVKDTKITASVADSSLEQRWYIENNTSAGTVSIRYTGNNDGLYLDAYQAANNSYTHLWTKSSSGLNDWVIEAYNGYYLIRNSANKNLVLTQSSSLTVSDRPQVVIQSLGSSPTNAQLWTIK